MSMQRIIDSANGLGGVLELAPESGSDYPAIAWGDHFFYYAPNGAVPQRDQPFATIVTKDYPNDSASQLDSPGRWRVNIHVGSATQRKFIGEDPTDVDFTAADRLLPHPVYARQGWVCVVTPGPSTAALVGELLACAHAAAVRLAQRG